MFFMLKMALFIHRFMLHPDTLTVILHLSPTGHSHTSAISARTHCFSSLLFHLDDLMSRQPTTHRSVITTHLHTQHRVLCPSSIAWLMP